MKYATPKRLSETEKNTAISFLASLQYHYPNVSWDTWRELFGFKSMTGTKNFVLMRTTNMTRVNATLVTMLIMGRKNPDTLPIIEAFLTWFDGRGLSYDAYHDLEETILAASHVPSVAAKAQEAGNGQVQVQDNQNTPQATVGEALLTVLTRLEAVLSASGAADGKDQEPAATA